MVPPPGSRGPGGPGTGSEQGHSPGGTPPDKSVRCEASRNLKWAITNTGIHAPVYKLTLPNPDAPGNEQPLFQISKPNPNATFWTLFYFTYAGHLIPPKRIEFGKIQKNVNGNSGSAGTGAGSAASGGGGGTRVSITGKSPEEKAVWQTLGEGNEDMVEWIVLCAALNVLDEEIIKAAEKNGLKPTPTPQAQAMGGGVPRPGVGPNGRQMQQNAVPSSRPTNGRPPPPGQQGYRPPQGQMRGPSPNPPPPGQGGYQRPPPHQMQGRPMPQQGMQGRPMPPQQQMQGRPMPQQQMQRPPPQGYPQQQQGMRPPPPPQNGRRF